LENGFEQLRSLIILTDKALSEISNRSPSAGAEQPGAGERTVPILGEIVWERSRYQSRTMPCLTVLLILHCACVFMHDEQMRFALPVPVPLAWRTGHKHTGFTADRKYDRKSVFVLQRMDTAVVISSPSFVNAPESRSGVADVGQPPATLRCSIDLIKV